MRLNELQIKNYRNLENSIFKFNSNINYIYGDNAQGKTNLLETIWMLTGTRSFRGSKDSQIIKFEKQYAGLIGKFLTQEIVQEIKINFAQGKRKIFLNGVAKRNPSEAIGKFRSVLFSPIHLSLVKDGPDNRRKFLDAAICQLKPTYTKTVIEYSQTLKHRNALLKNVLKNRDDRYLIDVWDQKLSILGSKVIKQRLSYLTQFLLKLKELYLEISGNKEFLEITYVPTITKDASDFYSEKELQESFFSLLKNKELIDIKLGYTSIGPHKDELKITLNGKSLRHFGSQGQQRSVVLAMKLAEASVLEKEIQDSPVILLDDVMSELDDYRKEYLISKIKNKQVFITGCDASLSKRFNKASKFQILGGKLVNR